jgi:hypothetical protein
MASRILVFKVSHCCPENSNLEEFKKNLPELLGKIIPPSAFGPRVLPKVKAWKYINAAGDQDDIHVQYVVNMTYDGNTTDYIEVSIDDAEVNGDKTLKGEIQLSISCENLCKDVKYKAWWQGGGIPLGPYRRSVPCVSGGYNCGTNTFTMGPCAMNSWGLAVGQPVKMFAFGGFGPVRWFKAPKPVLARIQSPQTPLINYRQEISDLQPQHNDDQDLLNSRYTSGRKDIKTEYHYKLDDLFNIKIQGVKPGCTHLTATDGVACFWSMAIMVSPSYCAKHGGLVEDTVGADTQAKTTKDPEEMGDGFPDANTIDNQFGSVVRRNEDLSIKGDFSDATTNNWCDCETPADLTTPDFKFGPKGLALGEGDWKVCGSTDNSDDYFSDNGLLLNSGNVVASGMEFVSTSVLINSDRKSGNIVKLNPVTRQVAMYVGQKVKIKVPDDVCKDLNGNFIDWDVRIVGNAAMIPSLKGDDAGWGGDPVPGGIDEDVEGSGWTALNPGPAAYSQNKEAKFWKIRKRKKQGYFELECLAPTNYLPTTIAVFPETSLTDSLTSLNYHSREQWLSSAVPNAHLNISISDDDPGAGSPGVPGIWGLRKHQILSTDGLGTVEDEQWIVCTAEAPKDDGKTTITHTTGAQLLHVFGFCPPVEWEVKGHTECSFKKNPADANKVPWVIPRSSEYGTLDAKVTINYKEGGLPLGQDGKAINQEPTTNYGWTIKFAIPDVYHRGKEPFGDEALFNDGDYSKPDEVGKEWALKKIKINDPPKGLQVVGSAVIFAFFKPFAANQASNVNPYYMEAVSKWWWLGDGDKTYSQPYHGPGKLKDSLQSDLKDKWGGVYEQPRGAICMWSTSENGTLKMPSTDIKRVFIVDKNGDVKVLRDNKNNKGLVGGGDNPLQVDPCA